MKIGIFGASGLVGYEFFKYCQGLNLDVLGTYNTTKRAGLVQLDILQDNGFDIFASCDIVIIAGAISNIDHCETEKDFSYKINVEKTINLMKVLIEGGIKIVFLSTDAVFDGMKGNYDEEDSINPVNAYGKFKVEAENFLMNNTKNYLIVRLAKNYKRSFTCKSVFSDILESLLREEEVRLAYDLIGNLTEVTSTVIALYKLLQCNARGVFHVAESIFRSRYEFGILLAEEYGLNKNLIRRVSVDEFSLKAKRASNLSLNVAKFNQLIK